MKASQPPHPPSHKVFRFEQTTISSDFDSGNLLNAECISSSSFNLWLCPDHPKNQYRTWFYFSIAGVAKGTTVSFNIKNMQNQSRLLNEGLVPVYRQASQEDWHRISHKIDLSKIIHNETGIEWIFKHTFISQDEHYFAFFYPWSNTDNEQFLSKIEEKCKQQTGIYFKRSHIVYSLEGRPVQFITLSSSKGILNKNQDFADEHLFPEKDEPRQFKPDKRCVIIGARVHSGEVPSSHVVTGMIEQLSSSTIEAQILRDNFVFYIFPIFNPDGVARGHYRVDTNGINLNRCYISPSPSLHPSIYAVRKTILHFHNKGKYFAFLDLHAHAARKGAFIYGNSTNDLEKQVDICLFPKILSMNSKMFEYEASNFTQFNMYCKDKNDSVSKEGAGRVALFKITKNPYTWTLECNYNSSRVENVIEEPRAQKQSQFKINQNSLNQNLIITHKYPTTIQPTEFYTIAHFRKLGKQICDSLLDLIGLHPFSRINNKDSYFKCVQNMRMNLAVDLLRMAPSRFDTRYKKLYRYLDGTNECSEQVTRALKALYFMLIKKAKIQNLAAYIKENDDSSLIAQKAIQKDMGKGTMSQKIRIRQKYSSKTQKTLSNREPAPKKQNQTAKQIQNFQENDRDQQPGSEISILKRQNTETIADIQHCRFKRFNCFQPQEEGNICNKAKFFRKSVNFTSKRVFLKSSIMKDTNPTSTSTKDDSTGHFAIRPQFGMKGANIKGRMMPK